MKTYIIYIIGVLLLSGCSRRGSDVAKQDTSQEKLQSGILQPERENPGGELPDSLPAVHVYTFNYSDPSFPCEPEGGAMIKGFDTDGNGRLYIAGGSPVRIACYNGQNKEFDAVISYSACNHAIMSLQGDSILFVEESVRRIAVLPKDGTGDVRHYNLPLKETDSIMSGAFRGSDLELEVYDSSSQAHSHEEFEKNTYVCLFPAQGSWAKKKMCDGTTRLQNPREFLSGEAKEKLECYSYKGLYHGMHLFYRHELFLGDIALVDKAGHIRAEASFAQMPPINTCCGEDEHIGWYSSPNLYRVKGYSFFLSAYDSKEKTISFLEYDLKPLYDFANSSPHTSINGTVRRIGE